MNLNQATVLYAALTDDQKVDLLARVSFDLTFIFRDITYTQPQTLENLKKLQGINELQHQLTQQLSKHHKRNERRYPDSAFLSILLELANTHGLLPGLQGALERYLTHPIP